ncbi:hypothetical protein K9N50_03230 [bacterium]|nr:hypothetical protein [bacterium]
MIFWLVLAVLVIFAFHQPKLVDDAFISFRYAKNLVDGNGLVYNPGERVEGYSNFLWVLLTAGGYLLGMQPEHTAVALSIPIFAACLLLSYLLALSVLKNRNLSFVLMILVGTNWTISSFASSGLETPLQLLEFLTIAYIIVLSIENEWSAKLTLALSIMLNISLLTRPDAVVLTMVSLIICFRTKQHWKPKDVIVMIAPFLLILLPYIIWKYNYYGSILPNTYYAKVHGLTGFKYGLFYAYLFLLSYLLLPYIVVVKFFWRELIKINTAVGYLAFITAAWFLYVILVGGDFMEFRFFVPIIPLILILIIYVIAKHTSNVQLKYGLILALFLGTLNTAFGFGKPISGWGVQNIATLTRPLTKDGGEWVRIGKELGRIFQDRDVSIALGMAGALPYYSGLKTIDMMGMNDANIPFIGRELSVMAGHRVIAPLAYLQHKEVNLILWPNNFTFDVPTFQRWVETVKWDDLYRYYLEVDEPINGVLINEAELIGIPIGDDLVTVAWYLTRNETIDEVLRSGSFYRFKLVR